MSSLKYLVLCIGLMGCFPALAQQKSELTKDEVETYKDKVKNLVSFLEFSFNTLGSAKTDIREKDIIINQSYAKIFQDEKVQVEDDLVENRETVTNKDVQAYLKDIDFFFREVKFEFTIEKIDHLTKTNGEDYFVAKVNRNLSGVDIEGETLNNNQERFIEINLEKSSKNLKIASIYTTQSSFEDELKNWWNDLSYEWQAIFRRNLDQYDSITNNDLLNISQIEKLDLSNNNYIVDLYGVSKLSQLKELDISNTRVIDLLPLRNLTKLEILNCSNTEVSDLTPLRYSVNLKTLISSNTKITDISTVARFNQLNQLNLAGNPVNDVSPISKLRNLLELDLSNTAILNVSGLGELSGLHSLNINQNKIYQLDSLSKLSVLKRINLDQTQVRDLKPLASLKQLEVIYCNNTPVNDISVISELPNLQRIYCDFTLVSQQAAEEFMQKNPSALVIFESEGLKNWWEELSFAWKAAFSDHVEGIKVTSSAEIPNKEQLAQLANLTALDLSENAGIKDLEPLRNLRKLRRLNLNHTAVADLRPLQNLTELEILSFAATGVEDISTLNYLKKLKKVNLDKTRVNSIQPLTSHSGLQIVYGDETFIPREEIDDFEQSHPSTLVIYKSNELNEWWNNLSGPWHDLLITHFNQRLEEGPEGQADQELLEIVENPEMTGVRLHIIAELEKLIITDNFGVENLNPVAVLKNLIELTLVNTRISDLGPAKHLINLERLTCVQSPVSSLEPIQNTQKLNYLNVENTPVEDLDPLENLDNLVYLNCAGTQVKKLNPLERLQNLEVLNCSNTRVRSLNPVMDLDLEKLICFNTRISQGRINKFRKLNPGAEIQYY